MSDLISRQAAIDAVQKYKVEHGYEYFDCANEIENDIKNLPSAQPYTDEEIQKMQDLEQTAVEMLHGTLHITVDHDISDVYRVWLSQKGTHYGDLYYPDYTDEEIQKIQDLEQAELEKAFELGKQDAQPEIIRCKDCKHQVKEWRDDKRLKDKGYWVYGCKLISDICGYWAGFGHDDEFCSEAQRRTDG